MTTMNTRPSAAGTPAPPRHAMIVHAYYPRGETRVQREAEALVSAGWDVDVLCLRKPGEPPTETYRGVRVHRIPMTLDKRSLPRQLLSYVRFCGRAGLRLALRHRRTPYRTVQVHNLPDFLVLSALVPKLRGVPVILDLHDLMPEFFAGRFPSRRSWVARLVRWQERMACRFADHVITVSHHWRETLMARGVPADRCSVVLNVADEALFPRRSGPPTGPEFHVLYHGTVTHRYGLDLAIHAVEMLKDELPDLHLTILGRGDAMPQLRELRDELGLADRVQLRDEMVLAERLPDLIAAADLGVVPYRDDPFTDGLLPTKLMEYAAVGIPCVAARTTAIERYFADTMVELFRPGDAADLARCIRALHDDGDRRRALARGAEVFTGRHPWEDVAAGYVALVERCAAAAGAPGSARARSKAVDDVVHPGEAPGDRERNDEAGVSGVPTHGTPTTPGRARPKRRPVGRGEKR